jgi:ribonuclease BN (tRNA processing enzyme)
MKIKFIGTGSGQTSLKRFHSSFLIQSDEYSLLVDTGDGTSKALLRGGVDFNSISALIYTHMHPDHSAGLPSLIVQFKMMKRKKELFIFCHPLHKDQLLSLLNSTHVYPERLDFPINFSTFLPGGIAFIAEGIEFISGLNRHLEDLKENPEGITPVSCGFLFSLNNKKVFYTGDIGDEEDLYTFRNEKIDIMIAESTHIPLDKIRKAFMELGADYLYLTHISDDEEIPEKFIGENTAAVFDGYVINI